MMTIDYSNLRNKTIEELKNDIFKSKKQLVRLQSKKIYLTKLKENNAPRGPIELIYNRIFNLQDNEIDNAQEQLDQCDWEEETLKSNLGKMEQEKRMKELAKVNDWWKANEDVILKAVPAVDYSSFKQSVFDQLVAELEKDDEVAFLQAADKILLSLLTNKL